MLTYSDVYMNCNIVWNFFEHGLTSKSMITRYLSLKSMGRVPSSLFRRWKRRRMNSSGNFLKFILNKKLFQGVGRHKIHSLPAFWCIHSKSSRFVLIHTLILWDLLHQHDQVPLIWERVHIPALSHHSYNHHHYNYHSKKGKIID